MLSVNGCSAKIVLGTIAPPRHRPILEYPPVDSLQSEHGADPPPRIGRVVEVHIYVSASFIVL